MHARAVDIQDCCLRCYHPDVTVATVKGEFLITFPSGTTMQLAHDYTSDQLGTVVCKLVTELRADPERKSRVVAALRSGAYPKTFGRIRRDGAFCALGVICDVSGLGRWRGDVYDAGWNRGLSVGGAPAPVIEWISHCAHIVIPPGHPNRLDGGTGSMIVNLAEANDGTKDLRALAFADIAAFIDEQW